jgi:hypothetical protein
MAMAMATNQAADFSLLSSRVTPVVKAGAQAAQSRFSLVNPTVTSVQNPDVASAPQPGRFTVRMALQRFEWVWSTAIILPWRLSHSHDQHLLPTTSGRMPFFVIYYRVDIFWNYLDINSEHPNIEILPCR